MQRIVFGIVTLLLICSCSTEKVKGQQEIKDSQTTNEPQTKIIVNKEYDQNGKLIKFDSSYSYYYSNIDGDSISGDSTFGVFRQDFFESFPNVQRPFLEDMFFEDSLLTYDFYKSDFFSNRFRLNRKRFNNLFEEMDSIKNDFYKKLSQPRKVK